MELEQLRQEMKHPKLNLSNPYMKDILNLYATRPTPQKALQHLVQYYDWLLAKREDPDILMEREALFRYL
jgi:hypothetical protein